MTEYERNYYHDVMVIKNVLIRLTEAIEGIKGELVHIEYYMVQGLKKSEAKKDDK